LIEKLPLRIFRVLISGLLALCFCAGSNAQFDVKSITGNGSPLTSIFMVNENTGFTGGVDGIFKTSDGGTSWQLLPYFQSTLPVGQREYFTAFNNIHIKFSDVNTGYAVGWNASGNFEEVIKTSDGGETWQVQHYFNPNTAPFQTLEDRLRDLWLFDSEKVVTVGHLGRILKTVNGGTSWAVKTSGTTKNLEAVSFLNEMIGIATGDKIILTTNDGGETWTSKVMSYSITDVAYLQANNIVAATSFGQIISSSDGGNSWREYGFATGWAPLKISFIDSQIGYVIGSGILLKTLDGGKNFEKLRVTYTAGTGVDFTALSTISETQIYSTTARGELYKFNTNPPKFSPISIFNSEVTSVCDNNGQPLSFTNQGRTDYNYQWLINKQIVSTQYDFSYQFTQSGVQRVTLVANNGNANDSSSVNILVKTRDRITKSIELSFEMPDTIELNAQSNFNSLRVTNLQEGVTYQLFRNGLSISSPVIAKYVDYIRYIEFSIPPAGTGGQYEYTVRATLTSECGIDASEKSAKKFYLSVPKRPVNVKGAHLTGNAVRLQWYDFSIQETHYQIERKPEGTANYSVIGTVSGFGDITFVDSGPLSVHKTYYYRVAAVNSFGLSGYSNVVSMFIHDKVIYVNPQATGLNNGSSWQHAINDIAKAFKESTDDEEIWLIKGTYTPTPTKPWTLVTTKGIYGGFSGSETERDQRNWRSNKTVFSGELGIPGNLSDNIVDIIIILRGNLNGISIMNAAGAGVSIVDGLIENCTIENNNIGVYSKFVDKCIVRNNMVGIGVPYNGSASITNSVIYKNQIGLDVNEAKVNLANSLFYSNNSGSIKARYLNPIVESPITVYNTIVGHDDNDIKRFDLNRDRIFSIGFGSTWGFYNFNYRMPYMSGNDGILGNDDDVFVMPDPIFHNKGTNRSLGVFPFFSASDTDILMNPRIQEGSLDIGPIEFVRDTIKVPSVKVTESGGAVSVSWPKVQAGVDKIWLQRTVSETEIYFYPLTPNTQSYTDSQTKLFQSYQYSIRLQKGNLISFPGVNAGVAIEPKPQIEAKALNNFYNEITYSYNYSLPVNSAVLEYWIPPNGFHNTQSITLSATFGRFLHLAPNSTYSYKIIAQLQGSQGVMTVPSETVTSTTPQNAPPAIIGQSSMSIIEGTNFLFSESMLQVTDDYNFPNGMTVDIIDGTNYTVVNNVITPSTGFHGQLSVQVRVGDTDKTSDWFNFILDVIENRKPVIESQKAITVVEGSKIKLTSNDIIASDDFNFPNGMLFEILPDNSYRMSNDSVQPLEGFFGKLTVFVRVGDGSKFSDVYSLVIDVVQKLNGIIRASAVEVTEHSNVDFSSEITGTPTKVNWIFEGGVPNSSNELNPTSIQYDLPGVYSVALTLEDELQKVTILREQFITVSVTTGLSAVGNARFKIYPNPNQGKFQVAFLEDALKARQLNIFNQVGQSVHSQIIEGLSNLVDVHLTKGVYIIQILNDSEIWVEKLIVD
jgi:photosystem II stability/assembly factor-like uncharacterized protein